MSSIFSGISLATRRLVHSLISGTADNTAGAETLLRRLMIPIAVLLGTGAAVAGPMVNINSPAPNAVITATSVTVTGEIDANDGETVTGVTFYVDGVSKSSFNAGSVTVYPFSFTATGLTPGSHTFTVKGCSAAGTKGTGCTTSAGRTVIINAPPTISITDPASGTVISAGGSFTFTVDARDSDGSISSVAYYANGGLIGSGLGSFSWSNVPAGTYTITAIATDNRGATTTSGAISVISNALPSISITSSDTVPHPLAPATFKFTPTVSDTDGTISKVEYYNGGTLIGTATSGDFSFSWSGIGWGTYAISAIAYDNRNGSTRSNTLSVRANAAPSVSLAAPAPSSVLTAPGTFTFTASPSDPENAISKVEFYSGATLIGSVSAPYTFTWSNAPAGSYSVKARVYDDQGATADSNAVTVVSNAPPAVSIASPASGTRVSPPGSFTFTANASDATDAVSKVEYFNGSTSLGSSTQSPYSVTWSSVATGSYSIKAVATDSYGVTTTSLPINVISNALPNASMTAPANNAFFTSPSSITLSAAASDSDGTVTKVEFLRGATVLATLTAPPYTYSWGTPPAGSHALSVRVTDNLGGVTTSGVTNIVVDAPPSVSITSPTDGSTVTTPATITITTSAAGGSSTVSRVDFYAGSTLIGSAAAAPFNYVWSHVPTGIYVLTAKTTDSAGGQTTSVPVTVNVVDGVVANISVPNVGSGTSGTLPGVASVGAGGEALYNVPIAVPPGTAGVVPGLSLNYSSSGADGLAGYGWTIGGMSSISRCKRTLAQDNYAGRVGLDANDRFCLDGQRLVLVSGTYGGDGAEYRTELDSASKIISYGVAGNGPAWFKVYAKSGQILEYGNTADSRIEAQGLATVREWALNKVQDRSNNFMLFSYVENNATGEYYPSQIRYTGNGQSQPYNAVNFVYQTRPDPLYRFVAGTKVSTTQRLTSIQTVVNTDSTGAGGTLVRDYRVGYQQSATSNRSLVGQITLCDGSGVCLPSTQLSWQTRNSTDNTFNAPGSGDWNGPNFNASTTAANWYKAVQAAAVFGDFDGDGRTDIAKSDGAGNWQVCLSTGSTFNCQTWTANGVTAKSSEVLVGDFNGDGRTDFAVPPGTDMASGNWQVCLSTGTGFNCQAWVAPSAGKNLGLYLVGDFSGDGRDDIAMAGYYSGEKLCRSNGSGFDCIDYPGVGDVLPSQDPEMPNVRQRSLASADLNGDGRTDILVWPAPLSQTDATPGQYLLCAATDTGFQSPNSVNACTSVTSKVGQRRQRPGWAFVGGTISGDIGGSGYPGIFGGFISPNIGSEVCLGTGSGLQCASTSSPTYPSFVADMDGDGRPDLVVAMGLGAAWSVCQMGVDVYGCVPWSAYDTLSNAVASFVGDFNGDGKQDLATYDQMTNRWTIRLAGGGKIDVLTAVVNGLGARSEFSFKPLIDPTVYTKDSGAAAAVYPQRDVIDGTYVVSQIRNDNGVGGLIATDYKYGGRKTDLQGRGDLGFRWVEATDSVSHVTTRTEVSQGFPFTGMATLLRATHTSGVVLKNSVNTLDQHTGSGGSVVFPYLKSSVETTRDLDNTLISTVTSSSQYDAYGNVTQLTQSTDAGGETYGTTTTATFYAADVGNWLVSAVQQLQVTKTAPNTTAITRTTTFDYVAGTLLPFHQTLEPNDAAYKLVTTYGRDGFGNVTQRTLAWTDPGSGSARSRRVDDLTFDARGRWPTLAYNALRHRETRAYDDAYGNLTQLIGPNQLATNWIYDSFGRKTRESRADGTYSTWDYKACGTGCGQAKSVVISRNFSASGSESRVPTLAYADVLGRETKVQSWSFDGSEIDAETEYDSLGRLARKARTHFAADTPVWTTWETYDDLGRPKSVRDADGPTTYGYSGLSSTTTNPKTQTRTEVRNGLGKIRQVTDARGASTSYAYDAFGNLLVTTDALGNQVVVGYDRLGRRTSLKDPDLGTWSYFVDPLGQTWKQVDAKVQTTTFDFDDLGRLTNRNEPDLSSYWVFDTQPGGIGALAEAFTGSFNVKDYRRVVSYDSYGRVATVTTTLDQDYVTTTGYDTAGRMASVTQQRNTVGGTGGPSQSFNYGYNGYGYLNRIYNGTSTYWQALSQDALGHTTREQLGNGLVTLRGYDSQTARLTSLTSGPNGTASVVNEAYLYDAVGNPWYRSGLDAAGHLVTEQFGFDTINRLTSSTLTLGGGGTVSQSVAYDAIGNLTCKSDLAGGVNCTSGAITHSYPAQGSASVRPHAVSSISGTVYGVANPAFSYDNNGNLSSGAGRSYTWTSFDMPYTITRTSVSPNLSDTFTYGPEHQRASQIVKSGTTVTRTLYYAGGIEKEGAGAATTVRTYLPSGIGFIAEDGSGTHVRYTLSDRLGSVVAITDEAGTVVERLAYDAWGKRRYPDGSADPAGTLAGTADNKGYTDHEMLDNVALIHMNGRVFDPAVARFTSADPNFTYVYDIQGGNRYAYVRGNPLVNTDPDGFDSQKVEEKPKKIKDWQNTKGWWEIAYYCDCHQSTTSSGGKSETNGGSSAKDSGLLQRALEVAKGAVIGALEDAAEAGHDMPIGGDRFGLDLPTPRDLCGGCEYQRGALLPSPANNEQQLGSDLAPAAGILLSLGSPQGEEKVIAEQLHHFATNKSKKYTDALAKIAEKYGLDLDGAWNKEMLPHRGRHPYAYHEFVLDAMRTIDKAADRSQEKFIQLFNIYVKEPVMKAPEMLRKEWWK